jgi:hypothetical protein
MKQKSTFTLPPEVSSTLNNPVTDDERLKILSNSGKNSILNSKRKIEFFIAMQTMRHELLSQAKVLDSSGCTKSLYIDLEALMPKTVHTIQKVWKKDDLSEKFIQLYHVLQPLMNHIQNQFLIDSECNRMTRSNSTRMNSNPVFKKLKEMEEVMRMVDAAVVDERCSELEIAFTRVKLTPQQISRRWSKDRIPTAPNLNICLRCKHESTNVPIENDEICDYNKKVIEKYNTDMKLWDKYMNEKSKAGDSATKKPAGMKSKPRMGKLKHPIIQCMCATSFCLSENDKNPTCPIRCIKKQESTQDNNINNNPFATTTDETSNELGRYKYEGLPYPMCTCPICQCKCSFTCYISDVPKLLFATRNCTSLFKTHHQQNISFSKEAQVSSCGEVRSMLGSMMGDAVKVGIQEAKNAFSRQYVQDTPQQLSKSSSLSTTSQSNFDKQLQQRTESLVYETIATNLSSKVRNIPMDTRVGLQKMIGGSSTIVELPGGPFNTKSIISGGQHGQNNHLGAKGNEGRAVQEGMLSNLDINFGTTVTEQYERLKDCRLKMLHDQKQKVNGKRNNDDNEMPVVTPMKKSRLSECTSSSSGNNTIDLTALKSDEASVSLSGGMHLFTAADEDVNRNNKSIVDQMHTRIVIRSRTELTALVNESKVRNKSTNDEETLKKRRKIIKRNLKLIRAAERKGEHIDNILAVTDNGKDLEGDNPMSSQDVLDSIAVLFSDEED